MREWDLRALEHLESLRDSLTKVELIDFIHLGAVEVWRANRDRHEPEELYDDAFTLSVISSRNLSNRMFEQITADQSWHAAGVRASREFTSTVLHACGADLRLVKAPYSAGRRPSFVSDFDWTDSESRLAAAARNHAAYSPAAVQVGAEPLFTLEHPGSAQAVRRCRDAFLVWAAELSSGLTAGWLGLPTAAPDRWLAVTPLWWDEPPTSAARGGSDDASPNGSPSFESKPAPVPAISLKPRQADGDAQ